MNASSFIYCFINLLFRLYRNSHQWIFRLPFKSQYRSTLSITLMHWLNRSAPHTDRQFKWIVYLCAASVHSRHPYPLYMQNYYYIFSVCTDAMLLLLLLFLLLIYTTTDGHKSNSETTTKFATHWIMKSCVFSRSIQFV